MVVSGQGPAMYAENCYGQWVCTHCPNGAQSARMWTVQQHTDWPGGRGVGRPLGLPRVRDVLPGRGGLYRTTKAPEPTGRAACCPLRVCQPTAPYGVRLATTSVPGCRAGVRSLRSDQPRARTVYCAVGVYPAVRKSTIKAATTGANGAGLVGVYGRCDPCSHEDPG